ncbi:hypothetical protein HPP92_016011 [Vanilla planifolia]|uniref:Uncharacterized protein n=1 Tax=Vanilla planifolia TaxID=51239 RepID=A0A835QJ76_VANPL|nr:hypothetical protein HPP92_016011 [Vanilla planifolia]
MLAWGGESYEGRGRNDVRRSHSAVCGQESNRRVWARNNSRNRSEVVLTNQPPAGSQPVEFLISEATKGKNIVQSTIEDDIYAYDVPQARR